MNTFEDMKVNAAANCAWCENKTDNQACAACRGMNGFKKDDTALEGVLLALGFMPSEKPDPSREDKAAFAERLSELLSHVPGLEKATCAYGGVEFKPDGSIKAFMPWPKGNMRPNPIEEYLQLKFESESDECAHCQCVSCDSLAAMLIDFGKLIKSVI